MKYILLNKTTHKFNTNMNIWLLCSTAYQAIWEIKCSLEFRNQLADSVANIQVYLNSHFL